MSRVITPCACDLGDAKSIFTQIKKTYAQLKSIGTSVTDEEEALYEFLEESDIFATLVLGYDSLNDTTRRDFVAQMLEAKEIYSKPANNNLLSYAIKNGKIELADQIILNVDNLDLRAALNEVLSKYPEGESKCDRIVLLLAAGAIKYEDRRIIENYLSESTDAVKTKSSVCIAVLDQGIQISSALLMAQVIKKADSEMVKNINRIL